MHLATPWRQTILAVLMLTWGMDSQAYLDPGSGSILLQIILGGVAGLAVAGKLYWQRILQMFRPRRSESSDEPIDPDD